jgi:hypothetical protein
LQIELGKRRGEPRTADSEMEINPMTARSTKVWASVNMTVAAVAALVMAATMAAGAWQTQTTSREPQFENEHVRA